MHIAMLTKAGIRLMENVYMEELSRDRVYEFLLIAAPPQVQGRYRLTRAAACRDLRSAASADADAGSKDKTRGRDLNPWVAEGPQRNAEA